MAISGESVAYAIVVVAGIALFAIGTPAERSVAVNAQHAADRPATHTNPPAPGKPAAGYDAAFGPHAPPAIAEAAGIKLRSVGFDFPFSDRAFPGGASADLVTNNCTACHSAGMILNQPTLTQAEWTAEVNKMLHTYKAPVSEDDVPGLVAYLSGMKIAR